MNHGWFIVNPSSPATPNIETPTREHLVGQDKENPLEEGSKD